MALTKVTGQVIKNTTDVTVGVLTVTNTLAVGGTVSIGGTLTYEDVTNIDSVGLITARNGIVVGSGITLSKDGDIFATGVTTTGSLVSSGAISGGAISGTTGTFTGDVDIQNSNLSVTTTAPQLLFAAAGGALDTRLLNDGSGNFIIGHGDNSATPSEKVRLTSGGNVGIGTNIPAKPLEVTSNTVPQFQVGMSNGPARASLMHNGSHLYVDTTTGDQIFRTGSTNERLTIKSSGEILIGTSETSANQSGSLNVFGTTGSTAFVSIRRGSANASGPRLALCKSRNTTDGAASGVVQDEDVLGTIHFYGNDSQGFEEGAAIQAIIDGDPGSNDLPTRLSFWTTPNSSDTKVERLRIDNSGKVKIGSGDIVGATTTLEVNSADSTVLVRDTASTSSAGDCKLAFGNASAYPTAYMSHSWDGTNGGLHFYTRVSGNEYERFNIAASGMVSVTEGTLQLSKQGASNYLEIGYGQNSNQFAYVDLIGDSTYTDFGARFIRSSGGANTTSQLVHRGTGALQIVAQDAGSIELATTNTQRMSIAADGMFNYNGVQKFLVAFTLVNNGYYYWDIAVRAEGGAGNVQHIVMGYNHYYTTSYGASRITMTASRGTQVNEMIGVGNQQHSQAGAWTVSKTNNSTYRIEKSAGTYTGSGYGFIEFTTNNA